MPAWDGASPVGTASATPSASLPPAGTVLDTCPSCWIIAGRVGLGLVVLVSALVAWSKRHTIAAAWRGVWAASRQDNMRALERRRGSASTAGTQDWAQEEWRWVPEDEAAAPPSDDGPGDGSDQRPDDYQPPRLSDAAGIVPASTGIQ